MTDDRMSPLQTVGMLIIVVTAGIPGLHLAGFWSGTSIPLGIWLLVAAVGGIVGGLLMAPDYRIAGAIGGLLAGPLGLLSVFLYCRGRESVHNVELVFIPGIGSLRGVGFYFLMRLLTDPLFPPPEADEEDERPRRKRRKKVEDAEEEEERPRRPRRRVEELDVVEEEDEKPRPPRRPKSKDEPSPVK